MRTVEELSKADAELSTLVTGERRARHRKHPTRKNVANLLDGSVEGFSAYLVAIPYREENYDTRLKFDCGITTEHLPMPHVSLELMMDPPHRLLQASKLRDMLGAIVRAVRPTFGRVDTYELWEALGEHQPFSPGWATYVNRRVEPEAVPMATEVLPLDALGTTIEATDAEQFSETREQLVAVRGIGKALKLF